MTPEPLSSERDLLSAAIALGARELGSLSLPESKLARTVSKVPPETLERLRLQIRSGLDPMGDRLCQLRSPAARRPLGAVYTPFPIVDFMIRWARQAGDPERIVEPGAGTARFLSRAAAVFPGAELVAVEIDPVSALITRANLAVAGLQRRARVLLADYRSCRLPEIAGPTLYIGNPPYVRHHGIEPAWKAWLAREAAARGYRSSQLAGLHVHFFLATVVQARPGDYGAFITAAEWLDVNYGGLVRALFLNGLGGLGITVIEPTAEPFPEVATTAAITTFRVGSSSKTFSFRRVRSSSDLVSPEQSALLARDRLESETRWSRLGHSASPLPAGYVELGELFRVHRGQVTGANKVWIAGEHSHGLPESALFACITKARELFAAGPTLENGSSLRRVIDLPADLSQFSASESRALSRFLELARSAGAHETYIARNRRPWWSVRLREPAPILATYMARRPPAFVRNRALVRHLNIAHGLYPREPLSESVLTAVVKYLSGGVSLANGRTYAGGLTKFEPREMERIPVPGPATLAEMG